MSNWYSEFSQPTLLSVKQVPFYITENLSWVRVYSWKDRERMKNGNITHKMSAYSVFNKAKTFDHCRYIHAFFQSVIDFWRNYMKSNFYLPFLKVSQKELISINQKAHIKGDVNTNVYCWLELGRFALDSPCRIYIRWIKCLCGTR